MQLWLIFNKGFSADAIFRNMSIFNFKNWPLGLEQLQAYGNAQLQALVHHFDDILIRNNCDIDYVALEWGELLLILIHTSEVERAFSLMNRAKQDWRARLTTPTLNELMRISLLGPTCNEFEPMGAIRLWWHGGRRARRRQMLPYGPRARQARCELEGVNDVDAENEVSSDEDLD